MGKKCNLSDFDHVMIVGARQGGLSISMLEMSEEKGLKTGHS